MSNAKAAGLVTNAGDQWQLTRTGEQVVEALPDRDAVKKARAGSRSPRRAGKRSGGAAKKK